MPADVLHPGKVFPCISSLHTLLVMLTRLWALQRASEVLILWIERTAHCWSSTYLHNPMLTVLLHCSLLMRRMQLGVLSPM